MAYLLDKYWPAHGDVLIGGYTTPDFTLSPSFHFQSIGAFADYPVNRWSDGLIKFLWAVPDEFVLFMMDDYWLNAPANVEMIDTLADYLTTHDSVARLDVTGDRLGASGWSKVASLWSGDLILSDPKSPYHFSFQAAMWRKSMLLQCLRAGLSPWESEINGDTILRDLPYRVLGTTRPPMRYTIAVQQGKLALDGGYQTSDYALPTEDVEYITAQGWLDGHD